MEQILLNISGIVFYVIFLAFYVIFFAWAFYKIRIMILVHKLNCKKEYKEIKKSLKSQKVYAVSRKIIIITCVIIALYLAGAMVLGFICLFLMFITLGGTAFVDTGADSSWYESILSSVGFYFSFFNWFIYIFLIFYIYLYIFFITGIYANNVSYKKLKEQFNL